MSGKNDFLRCFRTKLWYLQSLNKQVMIMLGNFLIENNAFAEYEV